MDIHNVKELSNDEYMRGSIECEITYVPVKPDFCEEGFVVMAIMLIFENNKLIFDSNGLIMRVVSCFIDQY
jgi:LytS/YehU family sensor histidine kinase